MILVAGPYRSGTNDDPALIQKNVDAMTSASLALFRAGHLPVMGEWYALPLIEHAGASGIGDPVFNEIFHPISRRLVAKCDGVLRIGGASAGADEMVSIAREHGRVSIAGRQSGRGLNAAGYWVRGSGRDPRFARNRIQRVRRGKCRARNTMTLACAVTITSFLPRRMPLTITRAAWSVFIRNQGGIGSRALA
jgi:hypothetical protein